MKNLPAQLALLRDAGVPTGRVEQMRLTVGRGIDIAGVETVHLDPSCNEAGPATVPVARTAGELRTETLCRVCALSTGPARKALQGLLTLRRFVLVGTKASDVLAGTSKPHELLDKLRDRDLSTERAFTELGRQVRSAGEQAHRLAPELDFDAQAAAMALRVSAELEELAAQLADRSCPSRALSARVRGIRLSSLAAAWPQSRGGSDDLLRRPPTGYPGSDRWPALCGGGHPFGQGHTISLVWREFAQAWAAGVDFDDAAHRCRDTMPVVLAAPDMDAPATFDQLPLTPTGTPSTAPTLREQLRLDWHAQVARDLADVVAEFLGSADQHHRKLLAGGWELVVCGNVEDLAKDLLAPYGDEKQTLSAGSVLLVPAGLLDGVPAEQVHRLPVPAADRDECDQWTEYVTDLIKNHDYAPPEAMAAVVAAHSR